MTSGHRNAFQLAMKVIDGDRGEEGPGVRHDDAPVGAEVPEPVDPRRLLQAAGEGQEVLPEEERREPAEQDRDDDALQRVDPAELARP